MVKIEIKGLGAAIAGFNATKQQINNVIEQTLINTASAVRDAEKAEMMRVFDRPTPWTLRGMQVKAHPGKLEVEVGVLEKFWGHAQNALNTQTTGGDRGLKAFEKALQYARRMPYGWVAVPGRGAKLDRYGNMSVGQIRQILSWFDAAEMTAGYTSNMGKEGRRKRRKGTKKKYGWEYVSVPIKNDNNLLPGIYQRYFTPFGVSESRPILIFVRRASYRPIFNFERVARDTVERVFPRRLGKALRDAGLRGGSGG